MMQNETHTRGSSAPTAASRTHNPPVEPIFGPNFVNLFVVTRVGQLRNVIAFIKQEHLPKHTNKLLIMVTPRDTQLLENLIATIPDNCFSAYEVCWLPKFPTSPKGVFRRRKIYRAMQTGLQKLLCPPVAQTRSTTSKAQYTSTASKVTRERFVSKPQHGTPPTQGVNLCLHHPNTYYVYFERIIKQITPQTNTPLHAKVLIEEGLASYKWGCFDYDLDTYGYAQDLSLSANELTTLIQSQKSRFIRRFKRCYRHPLKALRALAGLIMAGVSCITHTETRRALARIKDNIIAKLAPRYSFGIVDSFDIGYFCFPEKMQHPRQIAIGEVKYLELFDSPANKRAANPTVSLPHIPENAVVFANQKYGRYSFEFEAVFSILADMGISNVYIKMHPREDPTSYSIGLARAQALYPEITAIQDEALNRVPIEDLLQSSRIRTLISVTSSCLMYVPLIAPETKAISIAEEYLARYTALYEANKQRTMPPNHLKQFNRDYAIFRCVAPEVEQFKASPSFELSTLLARHELYLQTDEENEAAPTQVQLKVRMTEELTTSDQ